MGINLRPEFVTSNEYIDKIFRQRQQISNDITGIQTELAAADEGFEEEDAEIREEEGEPTDFALIYE